MKKLVLLLLPAVITLWAADFWQSKPFTSWSDKDIQRMLTNSPWSREVSIGPAQAAGRDILGADGPSPRTPNTQVSSPEIGGASQAPTELDGIPAVPQRIEVVLRWQTALPVRQALIRARYGAEATTSPAAKQALDHDESEYIVDVSGIPAAMLRGDAEKIKQAARMAASLSAKGKETLHSTRVEFSEPPQTLSPTVDAFFSFPRSTVFTLDDKEVEFSARIGDAILKYRFRLKDMVFNGKLEL
jgi:hypothetical protein